MHIILLLKKTTLCRFIITACVYCVKHFSTTLCRLLILRM
nr:MAG TPA: hypothetical protein [Caudoviricetes sp.]